MTPASAAQQPQQPVSLEQLRDIQLPEPISWWPPAPGWWLLALLVCALLIWCGYRLYRHWQQGRYRRQALAELQLLKQQQVTSPLDKQQQLQQLNQLLRRTALSAYTSDQVAGLQGKDWLTFLAHSAKLPGFENPQGQLLIDAVYQQQGPSEELTPLFNLVEQWIKQHRRSYRAAQEAKPC